MKSCSLEPSVIEGIPLVTVVGYCNDVAGESLVTMVKEQLAQGETSFILDFTRCNTINSLGVSKLYVLAVTIVDDFVGNLLLVGLDKTKISILTLSGIIPMATPVASVDEACRMIRSLRSVPGNNP